MSASENKRLVLKGFEEGFNKGDASVFDEIVAEKAIDHQEAPDTDYREHIKDVVRMLRTAFPDLHFEVHDVIAEGDLVACRSTMSGTHLGPLMGLEPTGKPISVPHMHFMRIVEGQNTDLWHVWDFAGLLRQVGASDPTPVPA
jgi:steroid delta-isomerase-like uncharacterized protein